MRKIFRAMLIALLLPGLGYAAEQVLNLERAPDRSHDLPALQHGAKIFVNYCLNCHAASFFRYNKLTELGISSNQIKDNLMFTAEKIGEPMTIAMRRNDARLWFGAAPPDLTLVARARASHYGTGSDWLYTYLRSFYRDAGTATGWNNVLFPTVAMPHVLWELQGEQILDAGHQLRLNKPGTLSPQEYDTMVANLVGFMAYMAEPTASLRKTLGIWVLIFLSIFFVVAYALKREYWKDVH